MAPVHVYKVDMTCEGCSSTVQKVLNKNKDKGIEDFDVDLSKQLVKVRTTTLTSEEILQIIKKTGKQTEFIETLK